MRLHPVYDREINGWVIGLGIYDEVDGRPLIFLTEPSDIEVRLPTDRPKFFSQKDAQLAINNLIAHGGDQLEKLDELSDDDLLRICYEALPW